nr:type II secretion system F family protein [Pseudoxanthomonas broegbernensis]
MEAWRSASRRRLHAANLENVERHLHAHPAAAPSPAAAAPPPRPGRLPWDPWLYRAGLPPGWRIPLVGALAGLILAWLFKQRIGTSGVIPVVLCTYALLCWVWLRRRIERRQQALLRQLPDFLDHMVRLAALGNSLPMAFQSAAAHAPPPLRDLLDATLAASRTGLDLDRALAQASQPTGLRVLHVLAVVLGTGMRVGGRTDQVLQRMSDFMHDLQQARQELSATTSETRASAWVIGLLPPLCALLMAFASPEFFQPMVDEPLGHRLLLIALAMEVIGALLLYRLARSL